MGSPNEMVASYSGPARPFNLRSIPLVESSGGLEPRSRSRPARDAAPTIATTPALTSMCWPWSTSSLGPLLRIQTEALDSPDFVEIGAKPTREDGQRGRRNGGGSPWVPSTPVGTTEAQVDDMMMAPPAPPQNRPSLGGNLNPSYIISGFCRGLSVCIYNVFGLPLAMAKVRECTRPRRAPRASLALVNELTGWLNC